MHQFLKFIFGIKLYMFRTIPLSITRSFSLHTQQTCVMYITILVLFCKVRFCVHFTNFYVTETNGHSPLPGQQIPLLSTRFSVSNPGGDVTVRCTRKNVYLASCSYITQKLTTIHLSLEVWTFTGWYVSSTVHIEGSTFLKWFYCVGRAVMFPVTER